MVNFLGSLIFLIWFIQFINIFCTIAQIRPKGYDPEFLNGEYSKKITLSLYAISLIFTILVTTILYGTNNKEKFLARQKGGYNAARNIMIIVSIIWFIVLTIFVWLNFRVVIILGFMVITNSLIMLLTLIWIKDQKKSYKREISEIRWENKKAGRILTREQAHIIYEHHSRIEFLENQRRRNGYDSAGIPNADLIEAINSDNYYQMKKWIYEMEQMGFKQGQNIVAQNIMIQKMYKEMVERCKNSQLWPGKMRRLDEIARLDAEMSKNSCCLPSAPPYQNSCSGNENDVPPSYKTNDSSIDLDSLSSLDV